MKNWKKENGWPQSLRSKFGPDEIFSWHGSSKIKRRHYGVTKEVCTRSSEETRDKWLSSSWNTYWFEYKIQKQRRKFSLLKSISETSKEVDLLVTHSTWYNFCCKLNESIYALSEGRAPRSGLQDYKIYEKFTGERIIFKKGQYRGIESFTDADWAGSTIYRRSTSGYCTFIRINLVIRRSKKQNVVARSSVEAEYNLWPIGSVKWFGSRRWWKKWKIVCVTKKLYCVNKAVISIAHNPIQHDRTKHVEVDRHLIKEKIEEGNFCMPFVSTNQQIANMFTKGLFKLKFEILVSNTDIYMPTWGVLICKYLSVIDNIVGFHKIYCCKCDKIWFCMI